MNSATGKSRRVWLISLSYPKVRLCAARGAAQEKKAQPLIVGLQEQPTLRVISAFTNNLMELTSPLPTCWPVFLNNGGKGIFATMVSVAKMQMFIRFQWQLPFQGSTCSRTAPLTANYFWISLQPPSCILWWHWLLRNPTSSIGLEIIFLLIWSTSNSHYCQQQAVKPDPGSSNFKKVRQTSINICRGLSHPTRGAVLSSEDINGRLFLMNRKGLRKCEGEGELTCLEGKSQLAWWETGLGSQPRVQWASEEKNN